MWCLLSRHNATLLQGELLLKALLWFLSSPLFIPLSFSTLVDSCLLPFVSTALPASANLECWRPGFCISEPVWLLWFFLITLSCFLSWFNKFSLAYLIPLHLSPSPTHACIRFLSLSISPLLFYVSIPPFPVYLPSCYLSPLLSLLFLFFNTLWFHSMRWKWQTVSSTGGQEKKKKTVAGFWTQLDLSGPLYTRWAWQIALGLLRPLAHLHWLSGSSCSLIKGLMTAEIGAKAE